MAYLGGRGQDRVFPQQSGAPVRLAEGRTLAGDASRSAWKVNGLAAAATDNIEWAGAFVEVEEPTGQGVAGRIRVGPLSHPQGSNGSPPAQLTYQFTFTSITESI